MPRMMEIEKKLSMMREKHKHIVYLITEDRDIMQAVFTEMADTLKSFLMTGRNDGLRDILRASNGSFFYKTLMLNGVLQDAYEYFPLKEKDYLPKDFFQNKGRGMAAKEAVLKEPPIFFILNDFHIIRESRSAGISTAGHFLKQFTAAAQKAEEEGRFLLLFLVSPVLKVPEGFESEIEIIDVPEMDKEDIEEFLLAEALKEYEGSGKKRKEITPVNLCRIREAARDFRGVSREGLMEIIVDLQAEFGSFFGRAEDGSGTEENRRRISENRKRLIVELKKNEALHDPTVTILEPREMVAGMQEFMNWIKDVKEEFMDIEMAHSFGNEPPKGVLLTGVPGSGKTQAAKSVAAVMGGAEKNVVLVQFRMDNLLGGLVGDSEANFKRCRKRIEALAPCIVLMDEIEKTFSMDSASGKNDVKMNILTALLDWMQENKKQIFFFATSNSVTELKPELLRDGRFDMRFCVFMPTHDELVEILCLHMQRAERRAQSVSAEKKLFVEGFDYEKTAKQFLKEIIQYAEKNNKNMFYTGANLENLVTQTNRSLKKDSEEQLPYSENAYVKELLKTAKGKFSQPYGVTNMKNIVEFWLAAYENQYTNAGALDLLPFTDYDADRCEFREDRNAAAGMSAYDQYMSKRLREEIRKFHKERKGHKDGQVN